MSQHLFKLAKHFWIKYAETIPETMRSPHLEYKNPRSSEVRLIDPISEEEMIPPTEPGEFIDQRQDYVPSDNDLEIKIQTHNLLEEMYQNGMLGTRLEFRRIGNKIRGVNDPEELSGILIEMGRQLHENKSHAIGFLKKIHKFEGTLTNLMRANAKR